MLIHADLNPASILVAPGQPPAFLDVTPSWRPVEFALAMLANGMGPRQRNASALRRYADVPPFEQVVLRPARAVCC